MFKFLILLLLPLFLYAKFQVTTYFPLESFLVKRIAQNQIRTKEIFNRYLPNFKELSSSELSRLSSVKVYFHFGLETEIKYAKILKKLNPELLTVDMSEGIKKIDNNPYIWMDPLLLRDVAKNIYKTLIEIDNLNKDFYEANYNKLLDDLDQTFLKIKEKMNNSEVYNLFVFDDYWFYFAKRFRINLYKREKSYINTSDIKNVQEFAEKKSIKKLLINRGDSYIISQSLSTAANINIIEHNPFDELILLSQYILIQKISE